MHHVLGIILAVFALLAGQATPVKPGTELLGFTLDETPDRLTALLGRPDGVDDSLPAYISWLFKAGARDEHDYGYILCFRRSDGKLVSVTRNFDPEENVDHLFPSGSFTVHHWPTAEKPHFSLRLRSLPGDRLLLAMGAPEQGRLCGQLILIDRSALPYFFPWLE
jgi:hypothetical protein